MCLIPLSNVLVWKNFLKNPTIPTIVEVQSPPSHLTKAAVGVGWVGSAVLVFALIHGFQKIKRGRGPAIQFVTLALLLVVVMGATWIGMRRTRMTADRSRVVVSAMLKNIYHAFDFRQEELIYDTLAHSVSGDLLTQIYLEMRQGLELASQGGARVKVKEIEMVDVLPERAGNGRGFKARCRWNVKGSVGHWGHVHQRTNQYEAEFTIEPVEGHWKITELELLQEERIS